MLIVAAALTGTASAAATDAPVASAWSEPRRYFLQSTVQMPLFMWLATPFNKQARMTAFDLRVVTSCTAGTPITKKVMEVECTLTDLALSAAGMEQEAGLLQPIVTELDEMLTGGVVQLQFREDGNLLDIDLEGVARRNNRGGQLNENLRLVLSRAFAGLDLVLEDPALERWSESGSMLSWLPTANGTSGNLSLVYAKTGGTAHRVTAEFGGQGVLVPGEGTNRFDTRLVGTITFDPENGLVVDRTWTSVASPTASSGIAMGAAGYPYLQEGRVVLLDAATPWDVGASEELAKDENGQTAIQQHFKLGLDLGGPQ